MNSMLHNAALCLFISLQIDGWFQEDSTFTFLISHFFNRPNQLVALKWN